MYLHHPQGVLANTQDTRLSRLLGHTPNNRDWSYSHTAKFCILLWYNYYIHNGPSVISSVTAFLVRFFF